MYEQKAVVMGRNYASLLGMARAAGHAGCEVTIIRSVSENYMKKKKNGLKQFIQGKSPEAVSKYVTQYLYTIEPNREDLVSKLLEHCAVSGQKVILLPTDDYAASTIDLYQEKLREHFLFPHCKGGQGAVVRLMDKDYQKQLAIRAGLTIAKGQTIKIENGTYTIPDTITYPCFTKPEISFLGNKKCMKRCNNVSELTAVLDEVAKAADCPILVEDYIEIEKEYGMLGFCDGTHAVIPAMIHKAAIGNGSHKGVTLLGEVIPSEKYQEIRDRIASILEAEGFVGLFDVDLYEMNGVIYFNELNLRLGAFGYSLMCAGINLPGMLVKKLTGADYKSDPATVSKQIVCINDKVNLDDYSAGYISRSQYEETIRKADARFITDPEDTAPEQAYHRLEMIQNIKNTIRKRR